MRRELDNHLIEGPLCGISYRQGYLTGRYYAHDFLGRTLRRSAPFRTWTWRHGNVAPHEDEAARAALRALTGQFHALGWRVVTREAEPITEETVLRALSRISGDDGATAADVGSGNARGRSGPCTTSAAPGRRRASASQAAGQGRAPREQWIPEVVSHRLELVAPVELSAVCFRWTNGDPRRA